MKTDALYRRYDGPLPVHAAVSHDWDAPLVHQLENRKQAAWGHVRQCGHRAVFHSKMFRETMNIHEYHKWMGARKSMAHALETYVMYREWYRAETKPELRSAAE